MNFFSSSAKEENQQLTDPENNSKFGNVFSSAKNFFTGAKEEERPPTTYEKIMSYIEVETSYTTFLIVLGLGFFVLFMSLFFLPTIILNPQKFVSLFSLGSFIIISSFIFIHGTKAYFEMLFNEDRRIYTISYFLSIFVGMYFSNFTTIFFVSHLCSMLQLLIMIFFILSFIPGGQTGISFIISMIKSFFVKS